MEGGSTSLEITGTQEDHLSIQIENREDLASSIKGKMENRSLSHCVCKVPGELLKGREYIYIPSSVSIGPFHHGKVSAMEDQKWRYFHRLLSRNPNTDAILERCIDALRHAEQKARKFYCEAVLMGSDQFVEMMLTDGCFIIELFLEFKLKNLRRRDDPIFCTNDKVYHLTCDLILLENQLPFFILEQLFHLVPIPKQCNVSLIELALYFFRNLIPGDHAHNFGPEIHHLLDLIRLHYLPTHAAVIPPRSGPSPEHIDRIRAARLHSAGMNLEKATSGSPLDITFVNGELRIPTLKIHDSTIFLLGNLMAMEFCHPTCSKSITSYVILMEQLIKTKRDVVLLQEKNILTGGCYKEARVVLLFKELREGKQVEDFYYRRMCDEINGYHASKRRVWLEKVRYIYHRTRLGIAGFSLAMLLLVFLFTGVLFTVVNYLLHHFQ